MFIKNILKDKFKYCVAKHFFATIELEIIFDRKKDALSYVREKNQQNKKLRRLSLGNISHLNSESKQSKKFVDWVIKKNLPEYSDYKGLVSVYDLDIEEYQQYTNLMREHKKLIKEWMKETNCSEDCIKATIMETFPEENNYELNSFREILKIKYQRL